jgi:hypothetical protein
MPDAKAHARTLIERVRRQSPAGAAMPFAIETTIRQLDRYRTWWTSANGFFPGTSDLSSGAGDLVDALRTGVRSS